MGKEKEGTRGEEGIIVGVKHGIAFGPQRMSELGQASREWQTNAKADLTSARGSMLGGRACFAFCLTRWFSLTALVLG